MFGEEVWLHKKESNFPHFPDFCPSVPRCLRSYNQEIPAVMKVLGRFHLTQRARRWWFEDHVAPFLSKKWGKDTPYICPENLCSHDHITCVYMCGCVTIRQSAVYKWLRCRESK